MSGAVTGPDNEVDLVLQVVLYPVEGGVDEGKGTVTVGCLCAIGSCGSIAAMARIILLCGGVDLVELVRV